MVRSMIASLGAKRAGWLRAFTALCRAATGPEPRRPRHSQGPQDCGCAGLRRAGGDGAASFEVDHV